LNNEQTLSRPQKTAHETNNDYHSMTRGEQAAMLVFIER